MLEIALIVLAGLFLIEAITVRNWLVSLEAKMLKKEDVYVDKLKRVFAKSIESAPKKRGRLLGSKNKPKRGRPRKEVVEFQ